MDVNKGETLTFLESGKVQIKEPKGKPKTVEVGEGEVLEFSGPCTVTGVPALRFRKRLDRVRAQIEPRMVTYRTCGPTLASLEVPDAIDTEAERIDRHLKDRGALLKARLAAEAERLKGN